MASTRVSNVGPAAGAQQAVQARYLVQQCLSPSLRQAASGNEHLVGPLLLGQLAQLVQRLLAGLLDETAGVHDQHLGLAWLGNRRVSQMFEQTGHPLGVYQVLGTAQRFEIVFHLFISLPARQPLVPGHRRELQCTMAQMTCQCGWLLANIAHMRSDHRRHKDWERDRGASTPAPTLRGDASAACHAMERSAEASAEPCERSVAPGGASSASLLCCRN